MINFKIVPASHMEILKLYLGDANGTVLISNEIAGSMNELKKEFDLSDYLAYAGEPDHFVITVLDNSHVLIDYLKQME